MSSNPHDFNDPNRQGQYPPPQWNTSQPEDNASAHYPPASQYPRVHFSILRRRILRPQTTNILHRPKRSIRLRQTWLPSILMSRARKIRTVFHRLLELTAPQTYMLNLHHHRLFTKLLLRGSVRLSPVATAEGGSNCIRFNQECMFTPVSSQAQAFVPAHAAYPHLRNAQNPGRSTQGVLLYGAHGQPLPPQQQPQPGPDATLPPPQGMYQHPYGSAPPPLASVSQDHRASGRRGSGSGFEYPDPTNLAPVTPVTSTPGYQAHTTPSQYYPAQNDRRPSPQSAYPYDGRHSSSPHNSPYPSMHPSQGAMTPPPTSTPSGSRGGLNVRDMLNPGDSQGRSSTDSDMLNALNRRGLNQ
ncbi:uncharacterized protein ATNIH1004_010217 [Aspergillus tanneri]|uniref:Sox C-terminal domain-containing protein n=1 Tax=Aspergillus tanneri TaxID=1220188 RepID=A0A5M9M9A8_9EURO|nr:uncharacterized protein ATNIH1004_010217 [Aspergillus tanneri]KAA8643448.1 hypothetical protein ATNIH1004_010217 [Aspergillus tanneri]